MRLVGGGDGVLCVVWQAPTFCNSVNEISSRTQNGMWYFFKNVLENSLEDP